MDTTMKVTMVILLLFVCLNDFAQTAPLANAPGPAASPTPTPMAAAAAGLSGSAKVLALQKTPAGFSVLVSATDNAWISCTVSCTNPALDLATGQSWTPKGQTVVISLKNLAFPATPPDSYDVTCIPQFLTSPGNAAKQNYNSAGLQVLQTYALSPEPEAVTVLPTDSDWKPSSV